jgi:hypothetical protein
MKAIRMKQSLLSVIRLVFMLIFGLTISTLSAQNFQFHYDLRHTVSPTQNPSNFPTLYFEYFKKQDSGHSFIKPGSFLFKTEADLFGTKNNIGKFFLQVSQSFRFWKPKVFLSLQYSGGAGITEPKQYSYYIPNTFSAGAEYPFHWKNTWFSALLFYKYVPYTRPSRDFLYTFYWWKGLLNYKLELAGDFSIWTENKDHGDGPSPGRKGKRFFFFAEPQVWFNLNKSLSAGSKINLFYHVNISDNLLQVAPTIALRCKI